jgi:arylsulfatase
MGRRFGMPITPELLDEVETTAWELYHIETDPTESANVAAEHPAKLRELVSLWWAEAGKYQVLPLDGSLATRIGTERPKTSRPRNRYVYYPDLSVVPFASAPSTYNRPYSIEADVEIPEGGAEGVLFAQGGSVGGQVLYLKDGRLHYVHNYVGRDLMHVESGDGVAAGRHTLRFEFEPTGEPDIAHGKGTPGRAQLYIDGDLVGNAELPHTTPIAFSIEGASVGYDFGEPVMEEYTPPFEFTGTIHQVTVDVSGELIEDDEAVVARMMAQQ